MFRALLIAPIFLATQLAAETCRFTTECFEGQDCSETSFGMEIEGGDDGFRLVTDAETVRVSRGGNDQIRIYVGVTDSAFHVVTYNANGPARYSTHIYDGPLMVGYLGTCTQ